MRFPLDWLSVEITVLRSALAAIAEPLYKTRRNFNLRFSAVLWSRPGMEKQALFGLFIRHALTLAGGVLVSNGSISEPDLETGTGAVIAIIGIVWSIIQKKRQAKQLRAVPVQ